MPSMNYREHDVCVASELHRFRRSLGSVGCVSYSCIAPGSAEAAKALRM
jgi:hypothetical protein